MTPEKLLIKNCRIKGMTEDILVENGKIKTVAENIACDAKTVIEADGLCAAPGLVDMHVHLRDPGQTQKEDIETGCAAAKAGGFTSIACMPNTTPAADSVEVINYIKNKAKKTGVNVYPIGAVTKGLSGDELNDFAALKKAGAVAFSDDGKPVKTAAIMLEAMSKASKCGTVVISHCEDTSFGAGVMNLGKLSNDLGVKGIPNAAETCMVAREIALSMTSGLPVHIAHVSTAQSVELIRAAKLAGAKITAETCPHYFSLDESSLKTRNANFRMNPPLRKKADVRAVIEGLRDGTIDAIVTDHAPHTKEEKADFIKAPNGIIGLETSLAVGITYLVRPGYLLLEELIEKMTVNPAKILKIKAGTLDEGARADIVLFDPEKSFKVDVNKLHSKSQNTPYAGMKLQGIVKYTISSGKVIYKM